jgi:hypothetical protein
MPDTAEVTITVRELRDAGRWRVADHASICHGEAPGLDGEPQRFHLGISAGGDRLFLFREGRLPQELLVSELVSAWLEAARPRRSAPAADLGSSAERLATIDRNSYVCGMCGRRTFHPDDVVASYCPCCGSADGTLPKECEHRRAGTATP